MYVYVCMYVCMYVCVCVSVWVCVYWGDWWEVVWFVCVVKISQLSQSAGTNERSGYTGWSRKNATLTTNNFKKTRDRMKKLWPLLRIKFFSQQDDTKIVNFAEGVLILWPFSWGNVIFKICSSISKVTIYIPEIFHCLASPGKVSALAL